MNRTPIRPIRVALVAATLVTVFAVGSTLANHSGFHSILLADGTWGRAERTEFLAALAAQGTRDTSRVVTVSVTVDPMSSIDWHGHPGPSVVVVTGGVLEVTERDAADRCSSATYGPGAAFYHPLGAHRFTNPESGPATFVVTYFAPPGGLLRPADPGC